MAAQPLPKLRDAGGTDSPHYWPDDLRPETRDKRARDERRTMRRAGAGDDAIQANPVTRYKERRGKR